MSNNRILKIAYLIQKYSQSSGAGYAQSFQPGDYAKYLKSCLGIRSNDDVDLNSAPVNSIYSVLEKYSFSGEVDIALGVNTSKQPTITVSFTSGTPKNPQNIIKEIKAALTPDINAKLKSLPAPATNYDRICSVQLKA